MLACALTGLLVSPLSWDHHWVWVAPGIALLAHLGAPRAAAWSGRRGGRRRPGWCWCSPPGRSSGTPQAGLTPAGLVWYGPATYFATGDQPWYHEFHWHGLQLLAGNSFVLAGLAGLAALAVAAVLRSPAPRMSDDASLAELRERLVAEVLATSGIRDERIAAALRDVPRHLFLPDLPPEEAYLDDAIVTKRDADGPADQLLVPARHHGDHAGPAGPGPRPAGARDRRGHRL